MICVYDAVRMMLRTKRAHVTTCRYHLILAVAIILELRPFSVHLLFEAGSSLIESGFWSSKYGISSYSTNCISSLFVLKASLGLAHRILYNEECIKQDVLLSFADAIQDDATFFVQCAQLYKLNGLPIHLLCDHNFKVLTTSYVNKITCVWHWYSQCH